MTEISETPKVDPLIGRTLLIKNEHDGHTLTVERRDIEKHQAYWLRCSCGALTLHGSYWLKKDLAEGRAISLSDSSFRSVAVPT